MQLPDSDINPDWHLNTIPEDRIKHPFFVGALADDHDNLKTTKSSQRDIVIGPVESFTKPHK